jgi:hypothetical protein
MDENKIINEKLHKRAKLRVYLRKAVIWNAIPYVLVNAFLVVIYYLTTPKGYFWPIWPLLGWGLGLLCHAIVVRLVLRDGTQDAVEQEYQRLLQSELDK